MLVDERAVEDAISLAVADDVALAVADELAGGSIEHTSVEDLQLTIVLRRSERR